MPKRMVDDSLLNSPSMAVLSPRAQDAFVRFILLADDFGCFEVSPRQLAAKGWPDRQDVTEEDVAAWVEEFASRHAPGEPPVAMLWTERARRFCYLTGWFGAHGQRRRMEYDPEKVGGEKGSKRRTPTPPGDLLAAVMAGEVRLVDGLPPGSPREDEVSRENPPGNSRETENGKANDSVPAREMQVSRPGEAGFPRIPAAAVAVAVAVPDAVAAAQRLPSKEDLKAEKHPVTQALLDLLSDEGFGLTHPKALADELEAALEVLGIEDVARGLARDLAENPDVGSLGFYARKLIAAAKRPGKANGRPAPEVGPDLSWIDSLPAERQAEARATWTAKALEVREEFKPEAHPRVLAATAEALRQEFLS